MKFCFNFAFNFNLRRYNEVGRILVELGKCDNLTAGQYMVWPHRICSPRHRMPSNSMNKGLRCVSMTGPVRYCWSRHRMLFNSINKGSEYVG